MPSKTHQTQYLIQSEKDTQRERLNELKQYLQNCNYPLKLIENVISKAVSIPQETLREKRDEKRNSEREQIPFISTFYPNTETIFGAANNMLNILKINENTANVFKNVEIINSKRQSQNLKSLLTSARIKKIGEEHEVLKCSDKKCHLCRIIIEGKSFYIRSTNFNFKVNANMNCNVHNCIYVIQCSGCPLIYIGETTNFRLRTNLHRDQITRNVGLGACQHIHKCAKDIVNKFTIMPFFKIPKDDSQYRKEKELYFIRKFKPGLNATE